MDDTKGTGHRAPDAPVEVSTVTVTDPMLGIENASVSVDPGQVFIHIPGADPSDPRLARMIMRAALQLSRAGVVANPAAYRRSTVENRHPRHAAREIAVTVTGPPGEPPGTAGTGS